MGFFGIARFKFHESKRQEYLRLSDQARDIVRTKESGTLQYDIYRNGDQFECMVIERYRDSDAAMEHAANLGDLVAAVLTTVSVVHGELLGEPSAEAGWQSSAGSLHSLPIATPFSAGEDGFEPSIT